MKVNKLSSNLPTINLLRVPPKEKEYTYVIKKKVALNRIELNYNSNFNHTIAKWVKQQVFEK